MPVHGEHRHLVQHAALSESIGMVVRNISGLIQVYVGACRKMQIAKFTCQIYYIVHTSAGNSYFSAVFCSKFYNFLYSKEVEVIYNDIADIHVSGHACQEELKLIHTLIRETISGPEITSPLALSMAATTIIKPDSESSFLSRRTIFPITFGNSSSEKPREVQSSFRFSWMYNGPAPRKRARRSLIGKADLMLLRPKRMS